jgi:hypothetical protein
VRREIEGAVDALVAESPREDDREREQTEQDAPGHGATPRQDEQRAEAEDAGKQQRIGAEQARESEDQPGQREPAKPAGFDRPQVEIEHQDVPRRHEAIGDARRHEIRDGQEQRDCPRRDGSDACSREPPPDREHDEARPRVDERLQRFRPGDEGVTEHAVHPREKQRVPRWVERRRLPAIRRDGRDGRRPDALSPGLEAVLARDQIHLGWRTLDRSHEAVSGGQRVGIALVAVREALHLAAAVRPHAHDRADQERDDEDGEQSAPSRPSAAS